MARDTEIVLQPDPAVPSAEIGKANVEPPNADPGPAGTTQDPEIDKRFWETCLADSERAEQNWRRRGREIVQIYRNDLGVTATGRAKTQGGQKYNILFANTEVMLPAIYSKPPQPVVRSRFTGGSMQPMMPPPMMAPPPPFGPGMTPGPMGAPPPLMPTLDPTASGAPPPPAASPGGPPPGLGSSSEGGMPLPGGDVSSLAMGAGMGMPPSPPPMSGMPGMPPGAPMTGMLPGPAPGRPAQADIDTAAAVMEKALEIVLDDEHSSEAVKTAIKDVLLPGRGICRVRWKPVLKNTPQIGPDGAPMPADPVTGQAPTTTEKVWEEVSDEYCYWEDVLLDAVRQHGDCEWIAFRHLFTKEQLLAEFEGTSPELDALSQAGKIDSLLKWTEESAAKSPPSGGGYQKTASQQGDVIRKAMAWEVWDRPNRRVFWFIRDSGGLVLRTDPDTLQLQGFYPIPQPMLAVLTSDSRVPKPFYDLYNGLADDLEDTSQRIAKLTRQIKVRGAYNSASKEIAQLLSADDQKMVPVDGVDMLNGGLQNHLWIVPIEVWVVALEKLYLARDQILQAIYQIMGISDIMRGATKASETATAQRIKGTMGTVRLEDQRQQAANFARDLMRLKAEIIAKNFSPQTLEQMTGEEVSPAVLAILRSDFQRTCSIDIETDSTVQVDEQTEQQGMQQVMASVQAVMQGAMAMLQVPVLPPNQVLQLSLELLRMALHPVRNSRGVIELLDDFKEQLQMAAIMNPMLGMPGGGVPMMPPGVATGPSGPGNSPGGPPSPAGQGGPPAPSAAPGGPPSGPMNGSGRPPPGLQ